MNNLGARVYGLGAAMMGVASLVWGTFAVDWPAVPATLPGRAALVILVGLAMLAAGLLINWRRASAWAAGLVAAVFAIGVLLNLPLLAAHPRDFGTWDSAAEVLALASCGLVAAASSTTIQGSLSSRLTRAGVLVFGLCLFSFGAAHFVYLAFTASLVPKWLPPSQVFWAYATGGAQIAAGLAIVSGVLALPAARLLAAMYVVFAVLVHVPILLRTPKHGDWMEFIVTVGLIGAALIVADWFAARERA